jgi:hypothetical protein
MKMKTKDIVMLGMVIGIGLFFIGAMISNSFPSDSENLTSYKVSAFIKMLGIGVLTASMVIGGIIIEKIDKNLKMLLFIFGLILLIIYTIGSIDLTWHVESPVSGSLGEDTKEDIDESKPEGYGAAPGFEVIGVLTALSAILFFYKKRYKR